MSDDLSTRGIEHQRRRMTRDLGSPETADAGALDAAHWEAWAGGGCHCGKPWDEHDTHYPVRRDATSGLDVEVVCPSCNGAGEVMSGYYDPEPEKCYVCDGAKWFTAKLRAAESPTPEPGEAGS